MRQKTGDTGLSRARRGGRRWSAASCLLIAIPLAISGPTGGRAAVIPTEASPEGEASRQAAYAAAADTHGVPEPLLLGVSYLESRWDTNNGVQSTSGGYGPMHLTRSTLDAAAQLTGVPATRLRSDPTANIHGGAALLAAYQRALGAPAGATSDPRDWYGAVAKYSQSSEVTAARGFADEVYAIIATGAARTTDDGYPVRLTARAIDPDRSALARLGLSPDTAATVGAECPTSSACAWIPASYRRLGNGRDPRAYGNFDLSDRPVRQTITHIVLHDVEGGFDSAVNTVRNPGSGVSWHYTIRSSDGYVAQHVRTRNVGWQAGNWYVNSKSIGIEHEGRAADGAWYTEALYRSSARLVTFLAAKFSIPLDREHIIGHDNVPGITPNFIRQMHWDPGPYWDWGHYFDLLGKPIGGNSTPGGLVTVKPDFATNRPAFYGCTGGTTPCPARGSSALVLRSAPRADSPLVCDIGLRPDGSPSTMGISDTGARVSAGQRFAVAGRSSGWTAIWYLGQKGWLQDPPNAPVALPTRGQAVTPKPGRDWIPVYGRAYPEAAAYPVGMPRQDLVPLPYRIAAGQRYSLAQVFPSEYYHATTVDGSSPGDWTVVRGKYTYAQIQLGHRFAYVNLADVLIARV